MDQDGQTGTGPINPQHLEPQEKLQQEIRLYPKPPPPVPFGRSQPTAAPSIPRAANKKSKPSMARRIGNILVPKKKSVRDRSVASNSSVSVFSDNATHCSGGEKSVALTVHSQVTVKASNKEAEKITSALNTKASGLGKSSKSGWKKFKRLVGVDHLHHQHLHRNPPPRAQAIGSGERAKSTGSLWLGNPMRKRVHSDDDNKNKGQPLKQTANATHANARVTNQLDLAIRGRLDGVDILSLGPASRTTLRLLPHVGTSCRYFSEGRSTSDSGIDLNFDPLNLSFTGRSIRRKPADLVMDMISASAGKDSLELIMEGFIPGGGDRWSVKLCSEEELHHEKGDLQRRRQHSISPQRRTNRPHTISEEDDSTAEMTDDGSTNLPSYKLWDHIWGEEAPPPVPAHMQSVSSGEEEEDVLQLAAACSVPVDLDEDTFIIDSPEHFRSVRDLCMIPLQSRRFESAISIFDKMLKGLEEQSDPRFEHLQASTHHNLGLVHLCQGQYVEALERFRKAIKIRKQCLSQNHPDTAVSLMREGDALFALELYDDALKCYKLALDMSPTEDATRAKMLNNVGVIYYHQEKSQEALKTLTAALEIQRQWLDGPIRRESIVYDASITLGNMGKVFLRLGENEVAHSVFEEACLLQTTAFRKDHDVLLSSLENMALTLAKSEDYEKAVPILRSLLRSREAKYGRDHEACIDTMGVLAFILIKEMELDDGLEFLKFVAMWQGKHLVSPHSSRDATIETIAAVEKLIAGKASLWV